MNTTNYKKPKYTLDITFCINSPEFYGVAAGRVIHPKNGNPDLAYDDQQLADYNDMIDMVVSILEANDFDIVREHQTVNTYSYYIDFYPTDDEGNRWDDGIRIIFRFANHNNLGAGASNEEKIDKQERRAKKRKPSDPPKEKVYIKSFFVGSEEYPDQRYVIGAVSRICDNLKVGDYTDFVI